MKGEKDGRAPKSSPALAELQGRDNEGCRMKVERWGE
jgi:hypothetical protein